MCGIAALLLRRAGRLGAIADMTRALRHRGPDDAGYVVWSGDGPARPHADIDTPGEVLALDSPSAPRTRLEADAAGRVALGHRRLSIVDLSPAGHQPMASADGLRWLTYNGEVYNHLELRGELERAGWSFRTRSDTEVVLAAYERWGPDCVRRFVGMFAFVLVDLGARAAVVARDPFGIKPLYRAEVEGGVAFASEPKALRLLGAGREVAPGPLRDFLAEGLTDHRPETLFRGIEAVPPATWTRLDLDGLEATSTRYWTPPDTTDPAPFEEAARRLRGGLLRSVELHLRSDVPVGACLSGGLDSSSILGAMRHVGGPSLELHAVTWVEDDPVIGEERWADLAGAAAGARLHKVRAGPEELRAELDRVLLHQDEPFGGTSIYAQFRVFEAARAAGLKVMLDGQGADELLAGYREALPVRLSELVRRGRWRDAARFARGAAALAAVSPWRMALRGAARSVPGAWAVQRRLRGLGETPWLNAVWFRARGVEVGGPPEPPRTLRSALRRQLLETSVPMLLRFEDRSSMAHSIESRVPFLAAPVTDVLLALPPEALLGEDATPKRVLRSAMRGLVPDAVLDRRDKVGFATPEARWLRDLGPWVDEVLARDLSAVPGIDAQAVRERRLPDAALWRCLVVARWAALTGVRSA